MLKTLVGNNDLRLNVNIASEDRASDTDFYYKKLLGDASDTAINKIFDAELFEYKPVSPVVNYFIYFLDFKDMNFNEGIINNIEPEFSTYLQTATNVLNGRSGRFSIYDFKQTNNNILQKNEFLLNKNNLQILQSKPYVVTDQIAELNKVQPLRSGLPLFYDTFTFPFSNKLDTWINESTKFSDKPFLYNSFLLLEIYDSPNFAIQKKLGGIPIMVNDRYMYDEKSVNGVKQIRPVYTLTEGVDGYSVYFLKQYKINKLYIKYSFWDSLSGMKIPLIASSVNIKDKKCIQSAAAFNHNNEYVLFDLNFKSKTYKIYEFDTISKTYSIESYDFDLYQLYYDDYWAGKIVPNKRPIPLIEPENITTDSNYDFNVGVNRNVINITSDLDTKFVSLEDVQTYLNDFNKDITGTEVKKLILNKYYNNTLISVKKTIPATRKVLFKDGEQNDIFTVGFEKLIDTVEIKNNSLNDSIVIKNLTITDLKVVNNPLDHYLYANNKHDNTQDTKISASTYHVTSTDNTNKTILCESYSGYSSIFNFVNHNLLASIYYQIDGHLGDAGFDLGDSKSFGTYLRDNYYYYIDYNLHGDKLERLININELNRVYGYFIWSSFMSNTPNDFHFVRNVDPKTDYKSIINQFANSDTKLTTLYLNNANVDNYLVGLLTKNFAPPNYISKYFSKELYFYKQPKPPGLNGHLRFESEFNKFVGVFTDQKLLNDNINDFTYQSNYGNIRDYLVGIKATCNINKSSIISPGGNVNIDLSLLIGEMYGYIIYDIDEELNLQANLKIKIEDQHKNIKNITIPITYRLNS